ncbi:hypothetical protein Pmani_039630 [Petrolisthes manimaculis]|nr:hypothetical protein Pmani_039630 [Petrolisthes manimaculis]
MNAPRRDPHNAVPSTSVILGAVCGVVGFLIINVTVVMAVRQYSHRRARRRRYLDLQLEQHGGYLYNLDQFMADYDQQINAANNS